MFLQSLNISGVRNLTAVALKLDAGLNVFFGDNGAGKSSLLEAISFATTGRSFRTSKLETMVASQEEESVVFAQFNETTKIGIAFKKKNKVKLIKVNGKNLTTLSALASLYPTQTLSPESYHLIDSAPSERRKYLDWCLFHVKHSYHEQWKSYSGILKQRNALLRAADDNSNFNESIKVWNAKLCDASEKVTLARTSAVAELQTVLKKITRDMSLDFCDGLELSYHPGFSGQLNLKLEEGLHLDKLAGYTRLGPHKADLRIKVNGYPVKEYLSRGQKKVLINLMTLAQTIYLKTKSKKNSLFIIDDFGSELDEANQVALLSALLSLDNVQVVLSCVQQDSLKAIEKGYNNAKLFHVKHGAILQ